MNKSVITCALSLVIIAVTLPNVPIRACQSNGPNKAKFEHLTGLLKGMEDSLRNSKGGEIHGKIADAMKIAMNIQNELPNYTKSFKNQYDLISSMPAELEKETKKIRQLIDGPAMEHVGIVAELDSEISAILSSYKEGTIDIQESMNAMEQVTDTFRNSFQSLMGKAEEAAKITIEKLEAIKLVNSEIHSAVTINLAREHEKQAIDLIKIKSSVKDLTQKANEFRESVNKSTENARMISRLSQSIENLIKDKFTSLGTRLDHVIKSQNKLELVILFSRMANRIEYLAEKFYRDRFHYNPNTERIEPMDAALRWAYAVIDGEPSDQPMEDLLFDYNVLVRGNTSASPIDVSVPQNSLLQVYLDGINDLVEFENTRMNGEESSLNKVESVQSSRYYTNLFMDDVLTLEGLGYMFLYEATKIINEHIIYNNGTNVTLFPVGFNRTLLENEAEIEEEEEAMDLILKNKKFEIDIDINLARKKRSAEVHNFAGNESIILKKGIQIQKVHAAVLKNAVSQAAAQCPVHLPSPASLTDLTVVAPLKLARGKDRQFASLHAQIGLAVSTNRRFQRVIGCHLCTAGKCTGFNSEYISIQCFFRKFNASSSDGLNRERVLNWCDGSPKYDTLFPNSTTASQSARQSTAIGGQKPHATVNRVVVGAQRVNVSRDETICGVRPVPLKLRDNSLVMALGIDICESSSGNILRSVEPKSLEQGQFLKEFTHINQLWACPTPVGWITGISFHVSDIDGAKVLSLQMESLYSI